MVILQAYQRRCTHLITTKVLSSEKFLAACAAGKSERFDDCQKAVKTRFDFPAAV